MTDRIQFPVVPWRGSTGGTGGLEVEREPGDLLISVRLESDSDPLSIRAPADGTAYLIPFTFPFDPGTTYHFLMLEPRAFPEFPGWRAPMPTGIGVFHVGFRHEADAMLPIIADLLEAYRERAGGCRTATHDPSDRCLTFGVFDGASCRSLEEILIERSIEDAARMFYDRYWAVGDYRGLPVQAGQTIYALPAAEAVGTTVSLAVVHLPRDEEGQPRIDAVYLLDSHEYFQRLADHALLAGRPVPIAFDARTGEARERAAAASFRLQYQTPTAPAIAELVGGIQNVTLTGPPEDGTIPLGLLYTVPGAAPDVPILLGRMTEDDTARWKVAWPEPGEPPAWERPTEAAVGDGRSNEARLRWEDIEFFWGDRIDPIRIRFTADDAGPYLHAQRDLIPMVRQAAQRLLDLKRDRLLWLTESGPYSRLLEGPGRTVSNLEKLHLFNLLRRIAADRRLPGSLRSDLRGALGETYTAFEGTLNYYDNAIRSRITGAVGVRSLEEVAFDEPWFLDQIRANPTEEALETLSMAIEALAGSEAGDAVLRTRFGRFFPDPALPEAPAGPVLDQEWFVTAWKTSMSLHKVLSKIFFGVARAAILERLETLAARDATEAVQRMAHRFESLFGRLDLEVTWETPLPPDPDSDFRPGYQFRIRKLEYTVSDSGGIADRLGSGSSSAARRLDDVMRSLNLVGKLVGVVGDVYTLSEDPSQANLQSLTLSAASLAVDTATTLVGAEYLEHNVERGVARLSLRPVSSVLGAAVGVDTLRKTMGQMTDYHARGDETAENLLGVSAVGTFIASVGSVVAISGVGAPVGAALIGLGTTIELVGSLGAAAAAEHPLVLMFEQSYFGVDYLETSSPTHARHAWYQNVPLQISEFSSVVYPIDGHLRRRDSYCELQFSPTIAMVGSLVYFALRLPFDVVNGSHFRLELTGSSSTGLPAGLLGRYTATRPAPDRPVRITVTITEAELAGGFTLDDVASALVVVSAGEPPGGLTMEDFVNRFALATRRTFTPE